MSWTELLQFWRQYVQASPNAGSKKRFRVNHTVFIAIWLRMSRERQVAALHVNYSLTSAWRAVCKYINHGELAPTGVHYKEICCIFEYFSASENCARRYYYVAVIWSSDLRLRTNKFCAVLFVVVVHAGCDKQDSLVSGGLCRKLHGRPSP